METFNIVRNKELNLDVAAQVHDRLLNAFI